jgi:very-short-patch-repair endonuclease
MKRLYNHPDLKVRRKELRRNQTEAESCLWLRLRYKKRGEIKFYRQYGIGPYIVDFYCPKCRLAIELDGDQHNNDGQAKYDEERTSFLNSEDIHVLRFRNKEVLNDPDSVVRKILGYEQDRI